MPLGVENHLVRWGVELEKIHTMAWWEDIEIEGLTISCTLGQHYSGRLPWGNNQTLWGGYFLQDEYHKVYYTGDTGYGEFFKEIRERYGKPELMFSKDGQYDPAEQLTTLAEKSNVSVATPQIGETVQFSDINKYQEKWWREIK